MTLSLLRAAMHRPAPPRPAHATTAQRGGAGEGAAPPSRPKPLAGDAAVTPRSPLPAAPAGGRRPTGTRPARGGAGRGGSPRRRSPCSSRAGRRPVGDGGGRVPQRPRRRARDGDGRGVRGDGLQRTALYWNPAGLAGLGRSTATFEYAPYFVGSDFNFASVAGVTPFGTVAVGVTALTYDDMDVIREDVNNQRPTGETFSAGSYAVSLAYANQLTERFSIGGAVKAVHESISESSATGVGFDVGTLFTTPFRGVRLGASVANFGSKLSIDGEDLNIRSTRSRARAGTTTRSRAGSRPTRSTSRSRSASGSRARSTTPAARA